MVLGGNLELEEARVLALAQRVTVVDKDRVGRRERARLAAVDEAVLLLAAVHEGGAAVVEEARLAGASVAQVLARVAGGARERIDVALEALAKCADANVAAALLGDGGAAARGGAGRAALVPLCLRPDRVGKVVLVRGLWLEQGQVLER